MEYLFFLSAFLLAFTYTGYPLLLILLKAFLSKPVLQNDLTPRVSFIVIAHNEEKYIANKIKNTLSLNYPKGNIEILIGLDGCTDQTGSIVKSFTSERIRLIEVNAHEGKYAVRHRVVQESTGEVLVFSDANSFLEENALSKLVRNFSDTSIGCVCGNLTYRTTDSSASGGESLFKKYDNQIKKLESAIGFSILVEGSLCAVRKNNYPFHNTDWPGDLAIPMNVVSKNKRSIYDETARSYEDFNYSNWDQVLRRAHIIHLTLNFLLSRISYFNPFRYGGFAWGLWCHRVLPLLSPFILIVLFLSNLLLVRENYFFKEFLLLQCLFYLSAFVIPLVRYFILSQIAIVKGFISYRSGQDRSRWKPIRNATMSSKET